MASEDQPAGAPRSYRRRQLAWALVLLAILGFWAWWETPAGHVQGHLAVRLQVRDLPAGTEVDIWQGPHRTWSGTSAAYGNTLKVDQPDKSFPLPLLTVDMALRRLHQGYLPRLTSDWVVLRFRSPLEPPRFALYDLRKDLNTGYMGAKRRVAVITPLVWSRLSQDPEAPTPFND